jgi:hypothetical protein
MIAYRNKHHENGRFEEDKGDGEWMFAATSEISFTVTSQVMKYHRGNLEANRRRSKELSYRC